MPISTVKIGWWNRWHSSNLCITGASLAASSETTDHEASKTLSSQLSRTWRSTGINGEYLSANLGNAYQMGAVALAKHNLSPTATVRIRISHLSDFSSPVLDQTVQAWSQIYNGTELSKGKLSEFFNGAGIPTQSTITNTLQNPLFVLTFPQITGTFVRFDFTDTANADGYIEVGAVYAGPLKTLNRGVVPSWEIQRDHIARVPFASNGEIWSASVYQRSHLRGQFVAQNSNDGRDFWYFISFLRGVTHPLLVIWRDDLGSTKHFGSLWARYEDTPSLQHQAIGHYGTQVAFEEIL